MKLSIRRGFWVCEALLASLVLSGCPTTQLSQPTVSFTRQVQYGDSKAVLVIRQSLPIAQAIEELLILAECSREGEWEGKVIHLPL